MWVLTIAVGAALLAFLAMALWQGQLVTRALTSRDCTECGHELVALTDGPTSDPPRSYEVLACPRCADVVTTVHGARSPFAYCPSCRQLALEVAARAEGPRVVGQVPRVHLDEACGICGYRGAQDLPEDAAELGEVIPFKPR